MLRATLALHAGFDMAPATRAVAVPMYQTVAFGFDDAESVGNPAGNIADLAVLAETAHRHGIPLVVDNTVPTPILLRPIEHAADDAIRLSIGIEDVADIDAVLEAAASGLDQPAVQHQHQLSPMVVQ